MVTLYVVGRLYEQSRILDPDGEIDPYSQLYLSSTLSGSVGRVNREFAELRTVSDPSEIADRIRRLYSDPPDLHRPEGHRLRVLLQALPLAGRAGETFAVELLGHVPGLLAAATGEAATKAQRPEWPQQMWLLERAIRVACNVGRADLTRDFAGQFADLANRFPPEIRPRLISVIGRSCLRSLRVLGLRDEIEQLAIRLLEALPDSPSNPRNPESVVPLLQSRLVLAAAWLTTGSNAGVEPILDQARATLLAGDRPRLRPADYSELGGAYISAVGQGPAGDGLGRVSELFGDILPGRIRDTFSTAPYFARLYLNLSEDAVAAVCRMILEPPL
jgi:hypothetical protein